MVKWLHHRFPSVHVNVADRMSRYCRSPPGGAMIQSNIMKEETTTKNCEDTTKYSLTSSVKYKKKKIHINRHIIKYNVITEHILHRVAMETDF